MTSSALPTSSGPLRPGAGPGRVLEVNPEIAGWRYQAFSVVQVTADAPWSEVAEGRETAIVPLAGRGVVTVDGERVDPPEAPGL